MAILVQDLLVTLLAAMALVILVRRVTGVIRPAKGEEACTACPNCSVPRPAPEGAATIVPLTSLRSSRRV